MTIYDNSAFDNIVHDDNLPEADNLSARNRGCELIDSILGYGNVIPHLWYRIIIKSCGKPDAVSISILSDLARLYSRSRGNNREFQLSYSELSARFNYSPRQLYNAIVSLENRGLVRRRCDTIEVKGRSLGNFLYLTLNVEALFEIHVANGGNSEVIKENPIISFDAKKRRLTGKNLQVSNIDNNLKNNYLDINRLIDEEKLKETNLSDEQSKLGKLSQNKARDSDFWSNSKNAGKFLKDFHPISEEDVSSLRLTSSRDFNASFVNQLLFKLSLDKPSHTFLTKDLFMKYMTLALTNEMRQAELVNSTGFKLCVNNEERNIESYLNYIEDTKVDSPFDSLRRKIAVSFSRQVSHSILTKARFNEDKSAGTFNITTTEDVIGMLTPFIRERIRDEVRAAYGNHIRTINFIKVVELSKREHEIRAVKELSAIHSNVSRTTISPSSELNNNELSRQELTGTSRAAKENSSNTGNLSVWSRIRQLLKLHLGEGIDRSWFSKIEAAENGRADTLYLKVQGNFKKNYIEQHYGYLMDRFCKQVSEGSLSLRLQSV